MGATPATPTPFLFQNFHDFDPEIDRRSQEAEKWLDFLGVQIVSTSTLSTAGTIVTSTVKCNYATQLAYSGYITNDSVAQSVYFTLDGTSVGPAFSIVGFGTVHIGFTSTALTPAGYHTVTLVGGSSYSAAQLVVDRRRPLGA